MTSSLNGREKIKAVYKCQEHLKRFNTSGLKMAHLFLFWFSDWGFLHCSHPKGRGREDRRKVKNLRRK